MLHAVHLQYMSYLIPGISCYGKTIIVCRALHYKHFYFSEPNSDNCTEGSVRLVNSTSENEGRIEACRNGNWGPVCGVGVVEAYVVCRALGFDAGWLLYMLT